MPVGGAARGADLSRIASGERGLGCGPDPRRRRGVVFLGLTGSGTVVVDRERFAPGPLRMMFVPEECVRATRGDFAEITGRSLTA
jgi:hypothetical protein